MGKGQIQTSSQAGGITSSAIRVSTSGSVTLFPSPSTYSKPLPRRRRRIPGEEQSTLRRRATGLILPSAALRQSGAEHVPRQLGGQPVAPGGDDRRAHIQVERRAQIAALRVREDHGAPGLAHDQLAGGG